MKWLQLIFVINLFGIPIILAQGPLTKGPSDMPKNLTYGVALIYQDNKVICSGPHLKPWLVLTTADCLFGKDPHTLRAEVSFGLDKPTVDVRVCFYELHPGYRYENFTLHNLGMLVLMAEKNWDVAEFSIPRLDEVQKYAKPPPDAYVDEWFGDRIGPNMTHYYQLIPDKRDIVAVNLCKISPFGVIFDLLCIKSSSHLEVYDQEQIGIPFFVFGEGTRKTLLGVYTGIYLGKEEKGHVFLNILHNIPWITWEMNKYPRPPFRHC